MAVKRFVDYEGLLNFTRKIAGKFVKAADFLTHKNDTIAHTTSTDKSHLDDAYAHSQTAHAPTTSATTSKAGLLSAADKAKLDGIATAANKYTLPTASKDTLGGVKTTSAVTSSSGYTACPIISGVPYYKDSNTTYTLASFGITATAAEINHLDGVTANVQTQLNGKASNGHTHNYAGSSSAGGAANSSIKLTTARTIDGMAFDGTKNITHYVACSTAAGTAAKSVSLPGFQLGAGAIIIIKFTVTNTASNPTLNIEGTGAKPITYRGESIPTDYLAANRTYMFIYNGSNDRYELIGDINTDTNTTYTLSSFGINASAEEINCIKGVTSSVQNQIDVLTNRKAEIWFQPTDPSSEWTSKANISLCDVTGASILDSTGASITSILDEEKSQHEGDVWQNSTSNQKYIYRSGLWTEMPLPKIIDADQITVQDSCLIDDSGIKVFEGSDNDYTYMSTEGLYKWKNGIKYTYSYFSYSNTISLDESDFTGSSSTPYSMQSGIIFDKATYGDIFPSDFIPSLNNVQMSIVGMESGLVPSSYSSISIANMAVEPIIFEYNSAAEAWVLQYRCRCSFLTYSKDGVPSYMPPSSVKIRYYISN